MDSSNYFTGRSLLIVTKHGKERVIAPILETQLKVKCELADGIDTDILGTFSGEIERKDDAAGTIKKKCLLAYEHNHKDLIVASEGSFFPHPAIPFLTVNEELILLNDFKNDIEILVRSISTETNYAESYICTIQELDDFASSALFPSHALILSDQKHKPSILIKSITEREKLHESFYQILTNFGKVFVQTDMRACYNPSRMKVIENTTEKLAKRALSFCPGCGIPGFGEVRMMEGLPCAECNFPTRSVIAKILGCNKCSHEEKLMYPDGKKYEDPMYCDFCNP